MKEPRIKMDVRPGFQQGAQSNEGDEARPRPAVVQMDEQSLPDAGSEVSHETEAAGQTASADPVRKPEEGPATPLSDYEVDSQMQGIMPRAIERIFGVTWDNNLDFSEGNPLNRGGFWERLLRRFMVSPGIVVVFAGLLTLVTQVVLKVDLASVAVGLAVVSFVVMVLLRVKRDAENSHEGD